MGSIGGLQECYGEVGMAPHMEYLWHNIQVQMPSHKLP